MISQHTLEEIMSQPQAWSATLQLMQAQASAIEQIRHYDKVIFTGCGSTYYLAIAAAALYREITGEDACGLPASEIWLNHRSAYSANGRTLLVAISRSGETTETVQACMAFKQRGDVITFSCYPSSTLSTQGMQNFLIVPGQEKSVAQTRAFTSLYLAVSAFIAIWKGQQNLLAELNQLPTIGERILTVCNDVIKGYSQNSLIERFYFLGSGLLYGLACELSLKMKEMSLTHSEPFHFMEFRHGPQSMINENTLLVGLVSETNSEHEHAVLADMKKGNVSVLTIGNSNTDIAFESTLSHAVRGILYLPAGQLLAYERAIMRGLDPDHPNHLTAVVRLEH